MPRFNIGYIAVAVFLAFASIPAAPGAAADISQIRMLDLDTARRIAMAENPSLSAARDRVLQARERVNQARSSYYPRLDATGSGVRVRRSDSELENGFNLPPPFEPPDQRENFYDVGLQATYILFNGFERRFSNQSAQLGAKSTRQSLEDVRRLLLQAVASSYYDAQLAQENIRIAEADAAFNQRQVEDAQARRRVGTGSLSDVLNFEVQVNRARFEVIRARRQYEVSMAVLAALLGVPEGRFPDTLALAPLRDEGRAELVYPDSDPLIDYAVAHRPDILRGEFRVQQTRADLGVVRSEFYPSLDLSGTVDGSREDDAGFEEDDFGYSVGLFLRYNLFAGGASTARLRETRQRLAEDENLLEDTVIGVKAEVRQALSDLELAQESVRLERSNAELVQRNRDLVEKEYQAGQASLVRLNEAQRDLVQAQSRLALAIVSLRRAWENLDTVTARILARY